MKLNKQEHNQPIGIPVPEVSGVDNSRRKFNKAGIITPVLMSLSSKPVWAVECGVSGTMSGNLSNGCTNPPNGFTGDQFIRAAAWPPPYQKNSTRFDDIFGTDNTCGSLFGNATLLEVLQGEARVVTDGSKLKKRFNCKDGDDKDKDKDKDKEKSKSDGVDELRKSIKSYAARHVVALLNDALFPAYGYPGTGTFYSAIPINSEAKCKDRAKAIDGILDLSDLST
ncbi:MAG: hypothetical protein HOP23_12735 [Methylococcaceae bacterium]|nr:hypothetical protein [Methylococcaceae bacterium]